jgi:hypothetical protein
MHVLISELINWYHLYCFYTMMLEPFICHFNLIYLKSTICLSCICPYVALVSIMCQLSLVGRLVWGGGGYVWPTTSLYILQVSSKRILIDI